MNKKGNAQTIAIVILSLLLAGSMICSVALYYSYIILNNEWKDLYEDNDEAWCEVYNELGDLTNELLDELEYHDKYYKDVYRLEIIDCEE